MVHRGQPIGQAEWPPLSGRDTTGVEHTITADDVRAVRQILSDNAANHQTGNSPAWLLSGIATCPCGSLVRVSIGGRTGGARPIYRCRDGGPGGHISRNAAPVDEWVREVIAARLRLPDLADLLARDEDAVDVDTLRAEVATLSERLESLAILLADGTLDGPGYKTSAGRVRERLEAAQGALSASLRRSPLSPVLTAADPGDAFLAAAADVQRSVVRELCTVELRKPRVGRVPFNPDDIVITWRT
jgi:hypothetical protein